MNKSNVVPLDLPGGAKKSAAKEAAMYQGVACEIPSCPSWLPVFAKQHWRFVTKELQKAGTIAKLDLGALTILCVAFSGMRVAQEQMAASVGDEGVVCGGEFQKTPNDYIQLSAYAVSYDRHSSKYEKLAKQFGLTVRAREQIKFQDPNQGTLEL